MSDRVPDRRRVIKGLTAAGGLSLFGEALLLAWLAGKDGALAFEKVTYRGNHLVPETNSAKVAQGRNLAFFKAGDETSRSKQLNALENEFAMLLQRRG